MKKTIVIAALCLAFGGMAFAGGSSETKSSKDAPVVLRYAHMNPTSSVAGLQADLLAKLVAEKSGGTVKIEVYPASQLGGLQEQAEAVSTGSVALHHNTMAGIGSLLDDFNALDTPFMYRDVEHLMKTVALDSPVMKELNKKLIEKRGVRVLYNFYFGARDLTANKAIYGVKDLAGLKIRSIPFPIYTAAVEGMGAVAVPLNFAELPTAIATGVVNGQENPVNTINNAKLYEIQSHLMVTNHILGAEAVVVNESVYKKLSASQRKALDEAAAEVSKIATKMTRDLEASDYKAVADKGMKIITVKDGLLLDEIRAKVNADIDKKFGAKYGDIYKQIRAIN
ncbi:MAG: TRAP transporter substrate-binding protein [Treponemataceae bacterium]